MNNRTDLSASVNTGTKEAIKAEFLREYNKKEASRITVKELCAMVPVARTTFYSYYLNTDEVLEEIEDMLISGLKNVARDVSGGNLAAMDFYVFLEETISYIKSRYEAFASLLVVQPDRRFEKKLKTAIKEHFRMRYPGKVCAANYELITEVMASAVLGGYRYWLENPDDMKENDIMRVITQTLDYFVTILK